MKQNKWFEKVVFYLLLATLFLASVIPAVAEGGAEFDKNVIIGVAQLVTLNDRNNFGHTE